MQGARLPGADCTESTRELWMHGELVRYTGCYVYAVVGIMYSGARSDDETAGAATLEWQGPRYCQ